MPEGIQLRRTKGWRMPPNTVSVARPSRWGNIYVVGEPMEIRVSGIQHGYAVGHYDPADRRYYDIDLPGEVLTAEIAVQLYRIDLGEMLADNLSTDAPLREALADLRGKNLGCFCALDQPCHRDVLLDLANR